MLTLIPRFVLGSVDLFDEICPRAIQSSGQSDLFVSKVVFLHHPIELKGTKVCFSGCYFVMFFYFKYLASHRKGGRWPPFEVHDSSWLTQPEVLGLCIPQAL